MKLDFLPAWERLVYGPDGDEVPIRSFSTSPNSSAATGLSMQEKEITAIEVTQNDCIDDSISPTSTAISGAFPTASSGSNGTPHDTLPSRNASRRLTWRPNFFQPRPFAGIAGLCVTVGCVFASLAILMVSDGQPVDSWTIEPTVYLAIVAAIANSALRLARFQAIPISWWYKASRGSTIRALERHWEINNSVVRAIFHSRHISLLNIACLAGSFVIIDGPLLQRASTVVPATQSANVTLNLPLPAELPTGFSGGWKNHILEETYVAADVFMDYLHRDPIHLKTSGCTGHCEAIVHAPGVVKRNCSTKIWPITPHMLRDFNASWGPWKSYTEQDGDLLARLPIYSTTLAPFHGEATHESAILTVGLASWFDKKGEYRQTICELVPAVVRYNIIIEGDTISLPDIPGQGQFVAYANNTKPSSNKPSEVRKLQMSTIDSITDGMAIFINANASAVLNETPAPNVIYNPDPQTYNLNVLRHWNSSNGFFDLNFIDPTPGIIFDFNRMMLRSAANASTWGHIQRFIDAGVPINQTVAARQTTQTNIFKSDLRWYAGAAVFELATALLILPLFYGWWTLGCHLTLSPFALALAFDAPILRGVNSAAGARGVVRELGGMRLKFGEVVASTAIVSNDEFLNAATTGRLGIAGSDNVVRPRRGMQFT